MALKDTSTDLTPAMRQYLEQKRAHPDCLLLFRMGDFYETFFEDAKTCSRELGITLTTRNKGPNAIPLAGVPYHAVETYLNKLIRKGYKVAISEQVEDPKAAKGLVERAVARIVTPGTLTEENLLRGNENNYLLAILPGKKEIGLAWADLSTGAFEVADFDLASLMPQFARINPAEILYPEGAQFQEAESFGHKKLSDFTQAPLTPVPIWAFDPEHAKNELCAHFGSKTLEGFGIRALSPMVGSAGAILYYLKQTQKVGLAHLDRLRVYSQGDFVPLDRATVSCLELIETQRSREREGTLLSVLDKTRTPMGARLLRAMILAPLKDLNAITERQGVVAEFRERDAFSAEISALLAQIQDVERINSKIVTERANARDLLGLGLSLIRIRTLKEKLSAEAASPLLLRLAESLDGLDALSDEILSAIVETPPMTIREGGLIRDGIFPELDELHSLSREGRDWMARFQSSEIERTGIQTLKVGYNKVFGYYIEVTRQHSEKVPGNYVRKQTIKNSERYVTEELRAMESRILTAAEKSRELEYEIFRDLRTRAAGQSREIRTVGEAVAMIDALRSLGEAAIKNKYCRPALDENTNLEIRDGRHPVLETMIEGERFVPNDAQIGANKRLLIITGPNMAGKSTYIRQVALIQIMAQIGSFVPATSASLGVADEIFTRIGSSDEIHRGLSTFMVEMSETANILNNATEKSLVVLDEVGRGTSTFDGLAIAWALSEYLLEKVRCRTLFATHYHELTELALLNDKAANYNAAVKEWGDEIAFLRTIVEGPADKSYGIHVAKLAGLPRPTVERAKEILGNLEAQSLDLTGCPRLALRPSRRKVREDKNQMNLFVPAISPEALLDAALREHPVFLKLRGLDVNALTPIEAIKLLDDLKKEMGKGGEPS